MSAVGLIINERSDRSASVIDDILNVTKRFGSVRTEVLDGINGLDRALIGMSQNNVETLIVGGGDGTIQATFTDSINNARFDRAPHYVALPCGMTNVIANDCGLKGAPAETLDNFLWRRERGSVKTVSRPLIKLMVGEKDPVFGFFFGAGAFHSAVEFSRDKIQARGAKRSFALLASIMSYTWKIATDAGNTVEDLPLDIAGANVPLPAQNANQLLFMATTLKQLGSGIYPFWGEGNGPLAVTTIKQPGRRLLRAAPFVLRAKSRAWFQDYGYDSWHDQELTAHFEGPFVFDGEIFEAKRGQATVFDCSHSANFLH